MTEQEKKFMEACIKFIAELDAIDKETRWQETEPEWWLKMSDIRRYVTKAYRPA